MKRPAVEPKRLLRYAELTWVALGTSLIIRVVEQDALAAAFVVLLVVSVATTRPESWFASRKSNSAGAR